MEVPYQPYGEPLRCRFVGRAWNSLPAMKSSPFSLPPTLSESSLPARYIISFIHGTRNPCPFFYGELGIRFRSSSYCCWESSTLGTSFLPRTDPRMFSTPVMHYSCWDSGLDTQLGYGNEKWPLRSKSKYKQGPITRNHHRNQNCRLVDINYIYIHTTEAPYTFNFPG